METILKNIASINNFNFIDSRALAGGDINEVYFLKCREGNFAVKINNASKFPGMFEAEEKGLQLLRHTNSFKIPRVVASGNFEMHSYLLLEYLEPGNPSKNFWELFAEKLAALHKTTNANFGLDHDNYIGSLPQKNQWHESASEFYIDQRLEPQLRMASERGFSFKNLEVVLENISEEIPEEPPALVHGDLWNGNFMVSENGNPVLIDPAVAFAPREMDISMMKLFGGFSSEAFTIYESFFPLQPDAEQRIPLWQLYYLLVHLNLFGSGYLPQVSSIIKRYS